MLKLREAIPIPEAGGRALSVRFIREHRCSDQLRRPLEGPWFARPNAKQSVHAERRRLSGFRDAALGTLGATFPDVACGLWVVARSVNFDGFKICCTLVRLPRSITYAPATGLMIRKVSGT